MNMKKGIRPSHVPLAVAFCLVVTTAISWQAGPVKPKQVITDTVPDKTKKIRDIDEAIEELNKSKAEVERNMKEIDLSKLEKEINESLKNVHIDQEKLKADIDKAVKEIDIEKMRKDIDESLAKIDMEKVRAEIEKIKEVDVEKIAAALKKMKPELEQSLKAAQEGIEKARQEMQGYKSLIDGLEKEGLINKKESYTIEYRSGELIVNGRRQPAAVAKKYKEFLTGHKDFVIKKDGDDFDIKNP